MLVRKHIVSPGRFWYPHPETGMPACLDATPDRIRKWCDNNNAVLKAGLSIPVPLEHDTDCKILNAADKAAARLKNNAGWAQKFEMDGDKLFGVLDIQDVEVANKLPKTIRYTSPHITSYMDGSGKQWGEVFGHVALTSRPRITDQQPFPTIQAAMSYATSMMPPALPQAGATLSMAGLLEKSGDIYKPAYPIAFSLWSGGIMLAEEPPKEPKKEEPKPKEGEKTEEKTPEAKESPEGGKPPQMGPDGKPVPEALVDQDGDIAIEQVVCDLLSILGIECGEGITPENFREKLYHALMDKHKADNGMTPPEPEPDPAMNPKPAGTPPNPAPVVQESQPMYMSIEQMKAAIAAEPNESTKNVLTAMLSMQQQAQAKNAALEKNAFDAARTTLRKRADSLISRAKNKDFTERINAAVASATFSLGDDGVVKDSLTPYLDMVDPGIRDLPALLAMPGITPTVQPHPADTTEGMSAERAKQIADEQCKNSKIGSAA